MTPAPRPLSPATRAMIIALARHAAESRGFDVLRAAA